MATQRSSSDLAANLFLEADNFCEDPALGTELATDVTSVTSADFRGYVENGRRYSGPGQWQPSDEQHFEAMQIAHLLYLVLDSQHENPLFRAPISEHAQYILDVGCGMRIGLLIARIGFLTVSFEHATLVVHGVDLYPPPQTSAPPTCILEVDGVGKPWTWQQKWDFIRIGHLIGSFSDKGWEEFYRQAYNNLQPGGWIEQLEVDVSVYCDDNTLPDESILNHSMFRDFIHTLGVKADRPITTASTMGNAISSAGFVNIHVHDYKAQIGNRAKHKTNKDAGKVTMEMWKTALEGWLIYLSTKFGVGEGGEDAEPMSWDETQAWLERVRVDLAKVRHIYQKSRRVWAQKSYDA